MQEFSDRVEAYRKNVRKEEARLRNQKSRDSLLAAAKRGNKKAKVKIEKNKKSARIRMSTMRKAARADRLKDNNFN